MAKSATNEELVATVDTLQQELVSLRREVTRLADIHAIRTLHFKYGNFID